MLLRAPDREADVQVHEARTRIKRARAWLRLLREQLGESVFAAVNAELRRAGHALAALREPAARLDALADLPALAKAEFDHLRDDLAREHTRALVASSVERATHEAVRHLDVTLCGGGHEPACHGAPRVRHALQRALRKGKRALRKAKARPDRETMHALRRTAKLAQYQTQLVRKGRGASSKKWRRRIARLGKLLGRHHDVALLGRELTLTRHGLDPSALTRVLRAIAERELELRERSLALARRVYARV